MIWRGLGALLCAAPLSCACGQPVGDTWQTAQPVHGFRVIASYPHDTRAFTQGLAIQAGQLYEGTGNYGASALRRVELTSGAILQEIRLQPSLFGEGITLWGETIVQLTWREQRGFIYDRDSLRRLRSFHFDGQGWGITHDGRHWIASDGSEVLRFLDPDTQAVVRRLRVLDVERPVPYLNELEYIKGRIWANIWHSDMIAQIDPTTGQVDAYLDLGGLYPHAKRTDPQQVLNGIAYDTASDRLFVTGKHWPRLYEIAVVPERAR